MERKGKWTRGPVEVELMESGDFDITAVDGPLDTKWGNICGSGSVAKDGREDEAHSNARIIASAFNAATTCEDMGYDGEACVKALPELVDFLERIGEVTFADLSALRKKLKV